MPDNGGGLTAKKNRGLLIAVGGGLVLAFLYIITRGKVPESEGTGEGVALQSTFTQIMKALQDGLAGLREEFEERVSTTETALSEQETEIAALEEQVSVWQGLIDALTETLASTQSRLGELEEEQAGLGASLTASVQGQMLSTAKSLFLSLEAGSQNRRRLNFIRNYVITRLGEWGYPQDVIDEFTAWVNPHIDESVTGRAQGGAVEWFLSPFYDVAAPVLDRGLGVPIGSPLLSTFPVRGRFGRH